MKIKFPITLGWMKKIRDIIKQKIKCTGDNYRFDPIIYYEGSKTKKYIIKNSLSNNSILQMSHVVYKIDCPVEDCNFPKHTASVKHKIQSEE